MKVQIFLIALLSLFLLFAFQNEAPQPESNLSDVVQKALDAKIANLKVTVAANCERKALEIAIPIADSLIAEMYARDLRAQDSILQRPKRPEMPKVEINPFPFDSIE